MSRARDPYVDARREQGIPDLWYAVVPGSEHEGKAVTCSYWIDEQRRAVRCDNFASLSMPI
jgi:hypothetical protein